MLKTFELQHGLIYLYHDGHLTRIVHDTPNARDQITLAGYTQHNKFERERNT